MTEQTDAPARTPDTAPDTAPDAAPAPAPGPGTEPAPALPPVPADGPAPEAAGPRPHSRALRAALRWTAAAAVCGGVAVGTALAITSMERTDVPGLATEHDGRWTYPELSLPALPAGSPRPYTEGNEAEIHHADLRQLLLPAPEGATVDKKADGVWMDPDAFVELYEKDERADIRQALTDSALRRIATRAWTMPDGTRTRIHLLQFTSGAYSQGFVYDSLRPGAGGGPLQVGVGVGRIDSKVLDAAEVEFTGVQAYEEIAPYGPEQTSWTYITAGDTLALITQTRDKAVLGVPYQQTVILQNQLLG
ncbi:hypothetical protein J7E88_05935 [Streptomyces sp. ISL-10]|uniref:hypothetical protein n=1 Tax=Streptomyces sp. ISL-10 TaxID=2819172 RepID=UPI001BE68B5A|nr:hypothetical protein [Streptomyces sp. ISL-10]MBT2364872.1 hypothetical protein [Streptomyces sp. ISL-10]